VVTDLLERVRERRPGLAVHAAFLDHMAPSPARVLERLAAEGTPAAVVLPLLLTAAYHSGIDLPGVLNRVRADHPGLDVRYGDTLGPDPALRTVLRGRLAEAGVRSPDPDTAVVLTSAGSSDPRANAAITGMAGRMAADARAAGPGWHSVVPAYASAAAPGPAAAVAERRAAGARRVVVASYFLAPGFFADQVAAAAYGEGADAVSPVLGPAAELADLLLARYDAVGAGLRVAA
jgi:sirohydrochlorin ferrochelatase